jgi:hypothetical protein
MHYADKIDLLMRNGKHILFIFLAPIIFFLGFNLVGCSSKHHNSELSPQVESVIIPSIKFYIDNSASMDGYLNPNSNFPNTITRILGELTDGYGRGTVEAKLANSKIFPLKEINVSNFAGSLYASSPLWTTGGKQRYITDMMSIMDSILRVHKENDVSIFVTDAIYALDGVKSSAAKINASRELTEHAFLSHRNTKPFSVLLFKYSTPFNGKYYQANQGECNLNCSRPYYIFVVGKSTAISQVINKVNFQGYEHSYFLTSENLTQSLQWSIPLMSNIVGSVKGGRPSPIDKSVHGLAMAKPRNGQLRFSIVVSYKNTPLLEDAVILPAGYQISNSSFNIGVEKYNPTKVTKNDAVFLDQSLNDLSKNSVVIFLSMNSNIGKDTLMVSMMKNVPAWVDVVNSSDDSKIASDTFEQKRTYGLSRLIGGIYDAFNQFSDRSNKYFTIKIPVNY